MKHIFFALSFFAIASLSCVLQTQAALLAQPTAAVTTPFATQQAYKPSDTPFPCLTVTALQTVYLREKPTMNSKALTVLTHGTRLTDEGGRKGSWAFAAWGQMEGWVSLVYVREC